MIQPESLGNLDVINILGNWKTKLQAKKVLDFVQNTQDDVRHSRLWKFLFSISREQWSHGMCQSFIHIITSVTNKHFNRPGKTQIKVSPFFLHIFTVNMDTIKGFKCFMLLTSFDDSIFRISVLHRLKNISIVLSNNQCSSLCLPVGFWIRFVIFYSMSRISTGFIKHICSQ